MQAAKFTKNCQSRRSFTVTLYLNACEKLFFEILRRFDYFYNNFVIKKNIQKHKPN